MGLLPKTTDQPRNSGTGTGMGPGEREGNCSVPVGVIPLLVTEFHGYSDLLTMVSTAANQVYQEFLRSEEGQNFAGQVRHTHTHTHTNMIDVDKHLPPQLPPTQT